MASDARNHTVPAASDHPSRATLLALALAIRDPVPVANTTARAAVVTAMSAASVPVSTSNPLIVYRADARPDSALELTTNGTTWWVVPLSGALDTGSYTPALTAATTNPSLGTGGTAPSGLFVAKGQWIDGSGDIPFGSTGVTVGSGLYKVSLPVAALASVLSNGDPVGYGTFFDSSAGAFRPVILRMVDSNTTARLIDSNAGTYFANATPVSVATGDYIQFKFSYPIA